MSKKNEDRVNKSVSFSKKDPFEKELLDFAEEQHDFSKFVKRLIFMYKMGITQQPGIIVTPDPSEDDKKLEAMKSINI